MSRNFGKKSRWNIYSNSIECFFEILYSNPAINLFFSTFLSVSANIGKNSSAAIYGFAGNEGMSYRILSLIRPTSLDSLSFSSSKYVL